MTETLLKLNARDERTAIINQKGEKFSFADFYNQLTKFSYLLDQRGINKTSKVLILANLDFPLYCAIASLFQLGATVVLVDPWASSDYIQKALGQVNPDFLLISKTARMFYIKPAIRRIKNKIILDDLIANSDQRRKVEVTEVAADHTALITFTSGTTGIPKGFDRTHSFLSAQQQAHVKFFNHYEGEIDLSMYPVFVLSNLKSGITSVLIKGNLRKIDTIKVEDFYQQLLDYKVNSISVSPVILEKLLNHCESNKLELPIKKIFTGGAPVKLEICQRVQNINPAIEGIVVYGSTEAEPIAMVSMKDALLQAHSAPGTPLGKVVSDLEYQLIPIPDQIHPFHQGKIGEVSLTGEFVGKKYWNNEAAFKESKWIDEQNRIWHKTGDIVIERDQFLYMIGRRSNPVTTPNGLLYPVPVESLIEQISGIKKAAYFQHQQKIFLVFEGQCSTEKIQHQLHQSNIPVDFILPIKEIPRDARHRSKIDLPQLKNIISQGSFMLTKESPLSQRLLSYTKERFPLIPIMIFVILLTSGYIGFLSHYFGGEYTWSSSKLWITMISVFLFMLQLRMADEIKDFEKDKIAYPERILSKGLVDLKIIQIILIGTGFIEFVLSYYLGIQSLFMMFVLQFWAFLMFKEFGAKKILESSTALYLFSHQLILPPLALYSAAAFINFGEIKFNSSFLASLLFLSLPYTIYEIARKTWSPDREHALADSYTKFWGIDRTIIVQMVLATSILFLMIIIPIQFSTLYRFSAYGISLVLAVILSMFKKNPVRKMSKLVELGGSLLLLGYCALNAFAI